MSKRPARETDFIRHHLFLLGQCQSSNSKMMMGIGTPRSQSNMAGIFSLLISWRRHQDINAADKPFKNANMRRASALGPPRISQCAALFFR